MVYGQGGTKITLYHSFSAGGYSYSALSLKLKYSATAGTNDTYIVEYSTSGATNCSDYGSRLWTTLVPSTGAAASLVAATASLSTWQNLTQLCVKAYSTKVWSPDNQNFDIYDIWTEGTYTIDTTPPTANVVYDINTPTSGNVTATLTGESEPITITNNGGSNTYVFTSNDSFTFEFKDAATVKSAAVTSLITRKQFAKMASLFALNVLHKTPEIWLNCTFTDMRWETTEMKTSAILACKLRIMGINKSGQPNTTFNPNGNLTRAHLGTILSRLLRWDANNLNTVDYYRNHFTALKTAGIMTKTDDPTMKEIRGNIMIMLKRAADK